jgi:hypothetical protein
MCSGGGQGATITMPDTGAYDRMADMQMQAMRDQQTGTMALKQQELNQALSGQQAAMSDFKDYRIQMANDQQIKANDTSANAARINAILGAPPPEKTAQAPVVGSERDGVQSRKGKKELRIDRVGQATPSKQAAGAGLNITTGV